MRSIPPGFGWDGALLVAPEVVGRSDWRSRGEVRML